MNRIQLLDCTLRDGGWRNNFCFGAEVMGRIFGAVSACGAEYAELGYLDAAAGSAAERSMYSSVEAIRANGLAREQGEKAGERQAPAGERQDREPFRMVMIDMGKFPAERLPEASVSGIDGIRLCFHKEDAEHALRMGEQILQRGYRLMLQPMVHTRYTEKELTDLIRQAAERLPGLSAFYVVDSFGSMRPRETAERIRMVDAYLPEGIAVGLHTHNALGFSLQNAVAAASLPMSRTLMLDASILGIGKGAGNLRLEEITVYLNRECGGMYRPEAVIDAAAAVLRVFEETPAVEPSVFALSAKHRLTPTYALFFWQHQPLDLFELEKLLLAVPDNKKDSFDRSTAEEVFLKLGKKKETPEDHQ